MVSKSELGIEPGERLVWMAERGGTAGHSQVAGCALAFFGLMWLNALMWLVLWLVDATHGAGVPWMSGLWLIGGLAAFAIYLVPYFRPTYFLTDQQLIERSLFGKPRRVILNRVVAVERYVARFRGRYGEIRELVTDKLVFRFHDGGGMTMGPFRRSQELSDLIHSGVLGDYVDLCLLPEVGGEPAAAELREDLFFVPSVEVDGMRYGPLLIGPSLFLRFTEVMDTDLLYRLYTLIGRGSGQQGSGSEVERRVREFAQRPDAGHALIAHREKLRLKVEGGALSLRTEQREERMILSPRDLERVAHVLGRGQSVGPMR